MRARVPTRLRALGSVFLPACIALASGMAGARSAPAPCADGRFLLDPDEAPLIVGPGGPQAIVLDGGRIAIETACAAVRPRRLTGSARGTRLLAVWPTCRAASRVRLSGRIVDECRALRGMRRARGSKARRFVALLSTCGDGIVDRGNDEECDGTQCGTGPCGPTCRCPVPTTTTSSTSTSTSSSTSVPPECIPRCGNARIDPECFEQCDGTAIDASCPGGVAPAGCPRCTSRCRLDLSCCPTTTSTSVTTTTSSSTSTIAVTRFGRDVLPILTGRCALPSCHDSRSHIAGLELTAAVAWEQLVGVTAGECLTAKRVVASDPDGSFALTKVVGAGPCFAGFRMPYLLPPLSDADIATIRAWIVAGARND